MLELEVNPGQSLGTSKWQFILGMHFSQAVAILQQFTSTIRGIHVLFNQANPLESDLVLHLTLDGIKLVFHSKSQRLKLINVVNMKLVKLTYGNKIFNAPDKPPTRLCIDDAFGATHPENFCQVEQEYLLTFPGLAFRFPADHKNAAGTSQQLRVASLQIYAGKKPDSAKIPVLPLPPGSYHLDSLTVVREQNFTKGVKLSLMMEAGSRNNSNPYVLSRYIPFGASCQTVLSSIGAPNKVFYKSEDKMKIHNVKRNKSLKYSDYFYNFFNLGLDILFDGMSHTVKKFVLHTNFPGHHNFNMYQRCNFELPLVLKNSNNPRDPAQLIDLPEVVTIGPASKWSGISRRLSLRGPPVVLRKTCSSGGACGGNTAPTSNVHLTNCYNHQDIIVEVMGNDHIAAITLFQNSVEAA